MLLAFFYLSYLVSAMLQWDEWSHKMLGHHLDLIFSFSPSVSPFEAIGQSSPFHSSACHDIKSVYVDSPRDLFLKYGSILLMLKIERSKKTNSINPWTWDKDF